jgi:DNA repair exonuclease SbcCD ATPase subunit
MLTLEQALERNNKQVTKIDKDLEYAKDAKCPTCEQELNDDKHQALLQELQHQHDDSIKYQEQVAYDISKVQKKIDNRNCCFNKPDPNSYIILFHFSPEVFIQRSSFSSSDRP